MTTATMKPKIVRVVVEADPVGVFYATSPDLKGLLVAERTLEALDREIPRAVRDLYAACGIIVFVSKADDGHGNHDDETPWVAFPVELARRVLAEA